MGKYPPNSRIIEDAVTGHLLFAIISDGREYAIFRDGTVRGFGSNPIIFNWYTPRQKATGCEQSDSKFAVWYDSDERDYL